MVEAVLDASAVLAFLRREPGEDVVARVLPRSLVSAVNLTEIVSKLVERGATVDAAVQITASLPFQVVAFDEALALRAGGLWGPTRPGGLSLGDRACLALAEREGLPAITTDQSWSKVAVKAEVRYLR